MVGARPKERWFDYEGPDQSLEEEWKDFLDCIATGRRPPSDGEGSLRTLQLVEAIYQAAESTLGASLPPSDDRSIASSASV